MKLHEWKSLAKRALLANVVLGGFLSFFGASNASAQTVVVERPRGMVRGGFNGPRYYYGPRERAVMAPHRYWDARFHCWRYR